MRLPRERWYAAAQDFGRYLACPTAGSGAPSCCRSNGVSPSTAQSLFIQWTAWSVTITFPFPRKDRKMTATIKEIAGDKYVLWGASWSLYTAKVCPDLIK